MEQPSAPLAVDNFQNAQDGLFNAPAQLARGRQARDPHARTVTYTVASIEDFEASLHDFLINPPQDPNRTDCRLSFWIGTSFLVGASRLNTSQAQQQQPQHHHQQQPLHPASQPHYVQHPEPSQGYQSTSDLQPYGAPPNAYQSISDPAIALTLSNFPAQPSPTSPNSTGDGADSSNHNGTRKSEQKSSLSILEALRPTSDPKEKMRKQRAIAKCCVDSIQKVDGYRYSFHNCWNSREDDSFRFSYYCNDSLLNKDRAANGKGAKLGKRATKPVYDCKGVLSVKFSAIKQSLDVYYKHIPVHKTYEERAPPPRKDSKRRKFLEEHDPDALVRIQSRPKPPKTNSGPNSASKARKKKKVEDNKSTTSLESDLRAQSLRSLLELIRPDPGPEPSPPEPPSQTIPPTPPQRLVPATVPVAVPQPVQQQPQAMQQPRKRSRNSCNNCKQKKTKCDAARPACQTCIDKKRQCTYQEQEDTRPPSAPPPGEFGSVRQPQPTTTELSELELMKRELEEARARINQLEAEHRRPSTTITPAQTPQMQRQPPPPPQPEVNAPTPSHAQQRQQPHHQQHQQPQKRHQQKKQQMQMQNSQPPEAMQQLQTTTAQLQPSQQIPNSQQLQTQQYNHFGNHGFNISRPMSAQNMPPNMSPNTSSHPSQQPQNPMHNTGTGLAPTAEPTNPYGREFAWQAAAYYGYQSAQQPQSDQWPARNSGVFR